jgi:Fur family zinc uptake transcriptional regulator
MTHRVDDSGTRAAWLARVEGLCGQRGLQLTALRRQVLDILAASGHPLSAYTIIDTMTEAAGRTVAPPTVYRTLDFLVEHGFVVRVESRNAFAICDTPGHDHHGVMLICTGCGRTDEVDDHALDAQLRGIAAASGFRVERQMVELQGLCGKCCGG